MIQSHQPVPDPLSLQARPLEQLCQECQTQLQQFQRVRNRHVDSSSCDEILRRAAQGDAEALDILLTISLPLIRQHCPPALRQSSDDVQQLVAERLIRKFRSSDSPYQAGTFAAYRVYLNKTIMSVCSNLQQRDRPTESLERLQASIGFEPAQPDGPVTDLYRHVLFARCEALLPDAWHREVFRRRIVRQDDVATIIRDLQPGMPHLTHQDVYRVAAQCILILSKLPEVRDMFESDGGNA